MIPSSTDCETLDITSDDYRKGCIDFNDSDECIECKT